MTTVKTLAARAGVRLDALAIYLNDHLTGATGGVELARRIASTHDDPALATVRDEIEADRDTLLEIMASLGVPARRYKVYAAWAMEKVGRLKSNGGLVHRAPLSDVVELEALALGVAGKAAGWRTLRELAEHDDRLDAALLDGLIARADRQSATLEPLRRAAADRAFRD
ncbi:hypothetical protein [Actinomadura atramentaria]|uniref:hypothetical protein n=1 Tax=Actinomadura atramentaria TaxID=1990 RepID=UPI0003702BBA|nr:hypothetical protein [Actinomadura atramentaria]